MTSRRNVFIIVLVVLLLIFYLGSVIIDGLVREKIVVPTTTTPPVESVNTDVLFEEESKKYEDAIVAEAPRDIEFSTEPVEEESKEEEKTEPTEDATSTIPIPSVTIATGGTTTQGTLGSYCWKGVCAMAIISDLPYPAIPVSTSSSIAFTINSEVAPERVLIFLKEINSTEVLLSRELTNDEVLDGTILLDQFLGEHLLFITGVFPGGEDVANAFKINIY